MIEWRGTFGDASRSNYQPDALEWSNTMHVLPCPPPREASQLFARY